MEQEEFMKAVSLNAGSVSLNRGDISIVCKHIADGLNMLQLISKDDDILISVPYDDVEKMNNRDSVIFSYNGCMRAVMNTNDVVKIWGL